MAKDLVLITGVTGHLGFRVLRYALEHGYDVRAAVRSQAKADKVASNALLKGKEAQLSFVVVPDITIPGAFDEAAKDVKYIIHVASPLASAAPPGGDYEKYFIEPAVQGTLGLLESAKKSSTVKRIVVTSSVIAIYPVASMFAAENDPTIYDAESRHAELDPPYPSTIVAYAAAKTAAFNRAVAWVEQQKPQFDVIHTHPAFIYGRDDLNTSTTDSEISTNKYPLHLATGKVDPVGMKFPMLYVHIDDCALLHVLALDPKVEGNQSFYSGNFNQDGETYDQTADIVAKHFPDAVKSGLLPNNGKYHTVITKLDNTKTEKTFGFKHASYEECVVSVVGHYLELREKEAKKK